LRSPSIPAVTTLTPDASCRMPSTNDQVTTSDCNDGGARRL
jgi:hypothetical protein